MAAPDVEELIHIPDGAVEVRSQQELRVVGNNLIGGEPAHMEESTPMRHERGVQQSMVRAEIQRCSAIQRKADGLHNASKLIQT